MEMVKRLEKELSGKKTGPKGDKSKGSKGEKKKKEKKAKGDAEGRVKKKDKKKRRASPSPGEARGGAKEDAGDRGRKKGTRGAKAKKKRAAESSAYSDEDEGGLFGEEEDASPGGRAARGRKDRGPFGGGDIVRYQGDASSDSETVFREAPTAPKASNQLKLVQYAKKTPGRLASRLLLKMQAEGAQGAVGANPAEQGEMTPPAAVHYFHTMMVPQLGTKLGMRAHREMRTALDLLARKLPAHAADLLGQRLKAIEKSCHDGHWQAAQYLELLGPDAGGLLERDVEVFMNREHLLDLKLKGYQGPRGGKDGKGSQEKGGKKGKERGKGKGGEREKEKKD